jgi:lon-related putative ATP-dependent protease
MEKAEAVVLTREKILQEMNKLKPKFDLRESKWRENPQEFLTEFFDKTKNYTTNDIRVPEVLRDWLIGQDEVLERMRMIKTEWIRLMKWLQENEEKYTSYGKILKERPPISCLFVGSPGTGKCYAKGTDILMYDGTIKKVEDVKVGDLLMGPDSKPRRVLSVTRGRDMMYKIIPVKGEPFVVNGSHILVLAGSGHYEGQIKEVTVKEWLCWPKTWKQQFKLFRTGVGFSNSQSLPLDPYTLGVILGDGGLTTTTPTITTASDAIISHIRNVVERFGLKVAPSSLKGKARNYYISGAGRRNQKNVITGILKSLSLYPISCEKKFIPQMYKAASRKDRLELLAGLMDTDGSLSDNGFDYVTKSPTLAKDVAFVARSLGFAAYIKECVKSDQNGTVGTYYRLFISGHTDEIPVKVLRKKAKPRKQIKDVLRTGFSVEKVGIDDYYGFMLDGDGRHLLGDFTVSHNSLLIKILAEELKEDYKKEGIELRDAVLIEDKTNRHGALLRYIKPAGLGKKLVEFAKMVETHRMKRKNVLLLGALGGLIALGAGLILYGLRELILAVMGGTPFDIALQTVAYFPFFLGMSFVGMPLFVLIWVYMFRNPTTVGWDERLKVPNLIVDNDPQTSDYAINVSTTDSASLFGDIAWDPWQSGGLGTPTYLRATAGAIHKAHQKILYIDELKNLQERTAIELLTILEDGEAPIKHHQTFGTTGTTAMIVETPPIKAVFWLCAAANNDILFDPNSILNKIPALRDRFEHYGDIIYFRDEVEATPLNQMMVCQVIRDEIFRFNLPPMEALGVKRIIDYIRTRASSTTKLKFMFRAVIDVIKKSAQLCWLEGDTVIREKHVLLALDKYVSAVETKLYQYEIEKGRPYRELQTSGVAVGQVNGLAVTTSGTAEGAGLAFQIQVWLKFVDNEKEADYVYTGIAHDGEDIKDSFKDVRTAIYRLYGIDIAQHCYTHVKFSGARADGPSAGVAIALGIMSILGDPADFRTKLNKAKAKRKSYSTIALSSVPIRQDIAFTGAMEIKETTNKDIKISAVGGINEKIRGARNHGIKYVVVPKENYDANIMNVDVYLPTKVLYGSTLLEYFEMARGDKQDENKN